MRIDIVTIFPGYFAPLSVSLIGKAARRGDITFGVHDLRSWAGDVHRTVDDTPFGGGPGPVAHGGRGERGPGDGLLGDLVVDQLGDDRAARHDQDAVAEALELDPVGGEDHDGRATGGGLAQDAVDVDPRAGVDDAHPDHAVATALDAVPVRIVETIYEAPPAALLEAVRESPDTADTLILVGHNPGTEALAEMLAAEGAPAAQKRLAQGFPTAALAVIAFGRWRGLTALAGLAVTFGVLLFFIVPAILDGRSPMLVAVVGSAAIMLTVLYLTHGLTITTTIAVAGTLASLIITTVLAEISVVAVALICVTVRFEASRPGRNSDTDPRTSSASPTRTPGVAPVNTKMPSDVRAFPSPVASWR